MEEKIAQIHKLFGLKKVGDIIRESKSSWGESTLINSPKKKEQEKNVAVADFASIKQQIQLLTEDDSLNLNKRDKKTLKKKLKRKLKKIKKENNLEEEEQSEEEAVKVEPVKAPVKDVKPDPFEYVYVQTEMTQTFSSGIFI